MFNDQKLYGRPMSIRMDKYECEEMPEVLPSKLPSGLEGVGKGLGIGGQPLNISKSLLNNNAPAVNIPVQPQPAPTPIQPSNALSAINNLAGNLGQLPLAQNLSQSLGMSQMNSIPHSQSAAASSLSNISLAGLDSTQLTRLVNNAGLINSATNLGNSALSSLANSSNVLGSLSGNVSLRSSLGLGGVNPTHQQQVPSSQSSGLSVYSSYPEHEPYRVDKYAGAALGPSRGGPMSDTILVRNLPSNFSWQSLRDRFNSIGEVRYAEIKAPGTAIVRFHSDRDAQRAVEMMHNYRIENHSIEVNFYY